MFRALRTTVAATALALGCLAPPPAPAVAAYADPVLSTGLAPSVVNFSDSAVASVSWMRIDAAALAVSPASTRSALPPSTAGSIAVAAPIILPAGSVYGDLAAAPLLDALVDGSALQAIAHNADTAGAPSAAGPQDRTAPVPEPATLALIALGLAALALTLRRA